MAAAHAAGWAHCDVRPSNIIVSPPHGACLVDWGAALSLGETLVRRGVPAFADARIFSEEGVTARSNYDALAALYTWLAVALDEHCAAPWLAAAAVGERIDCDEALFIARESWLRARLVGGGGDAVSERVAAVARVACKLELFDGRTRKNALALARGCLGEREAALTGV